MKAIDYFIITIVLLVTQTLLYWLTNSGNNWEFMAGMIIGVWYAYFCEWNSRRKK